MCLSGILHTQLAVHRTRGLFNPSNSMQWGLLLYLPVTLVDVAYGNANDPFPHPCGKPAGFGMEYLA